MSGEGTESEDSASENEGGASDASGDSHGDGEAGWAGLADVARKILQPALKSEVPILARDRGAERQLDVARAEHKVRRQQALERRRVMEKGHVIPDVTSKNYERGLAKIATRGVVRLFNTVRKQQRELSEVLEDVPVGRRAKVAAGVVSKGHFLDMLKAKGTDQKAAKAGAKEGAGAGAAAPQTSWLAQGFMMGARMKDWDRQDADEDDDDDGEEGDGDGDEDMDSDAEAEAE
jgi:hypothetical protein